MESNIANLPIKIGKRTIKNRVTMAPTVKFFASEDGMVTQDFVDHYEKRAKSGCGLIVLEATCVSKEGRLHPTQLGLWEDAQIEGHKKIVQAVHKHGALIIPQIHYGGLGTHPDCGPMTSPSKVEWNNGVNITEAKELNLEDIERIIRAFIDASVRAKKAGYDGVQLHACHSYLINDFASNVNKREDKYGKTLPDKARFGCEIIEGIRKECGDDFIISARISGADPSVAEAISIAECYVNSGCDYLQVSSGIGDFSDVPYDEALPYNKIAALGVYMHEHFKGKIPVSCVNGLRNVEVVHYMLNKELVDTVDLACGLLADPAFAEAILDGSEYVKCFNCPDCAYGPGHTHICPAMRIRKDNEFKMEEMFK